MRMRHAVIVHFKYGLDDLEPLYSLEDRLRTAIENVSVGEFDGDEMAADLSDGTLYMYGPDADTVFATVFPILKATPFMKDAVVVRRYCEASDRYAHEERTII